MNLTQMRDTLVNTLEQGFAHSDIPRFYENTADIDLDRVGDMYMEVHITFYTSKQITFGESPISRTYGTMAIMLYSKIGLGIRNRLILMDELTTLFKFKALSGLHTQAPTPGRNREPFEGWHSSVLAVPFFADSIA